KEYRALRSRGASLHLFLKICETGWAPPTVPKSLHPSSRSSDHCPQRGGRSYRSPRWGPRCPRLGQNALSKKLWPQCFGHFSSLALSAQTISFRLWARPPPAALCWSAASGAIVVATVVGAAPAPIPPLRRPYLPKESRLRFLYLPVSL